MDIKELDLYTHNLNTYSAQDIKDLEPMTEDELWEYQREIEYGTGNTSDWDAMRVIITFRKLVNDFEIYANQMKECRDAWSGDYYSMYAKFLDKSRKVNELEIENNKLNIIMKDFKLLLEEGIDLGYLISIEKDYGKLIHENADLLHFKEVAIKHLTEEQLLEIKDEMENCTDTCR